MEKPELGFLRKCYVQFLWTLKVFSNWRFGLFFLKIFEFFKANEFFIFLQSNIKLVVRTRVRTVSKKMCKKVSVYQFLITARKYEKLIYFFQKEKNLKYIRLTFRSHPFFLRPQM